MCLAMKNFTKNWNNYESNLSYFPFIISNPACKPDLQGMPKILTTI